MAADPKFDEDDYYETQSRCWWMWRNKFFEITPLVGYSFILTAKHLIEVFFWYLLIVAFTIVTIKNVSDTVAVYLSYPTRTDVRVASSVRNASIGNFTIRLALSGLELQPKKMLINAPKKGDYICEDITHKLQKAAEIIEPVKKWQATAVENSAQPYHYYWLEDYRDALYDASILNKTIYSSEKKKTAVHEFIKHIQNEIATHHFLSQLDDQARTTFYYNKDIDLIWKSLNFSTNHYASHPGALVFLLQGLLDPTTFWEQLDFSSLKDTSISSESVQTKEDILAVPGTLLTDKGISSKDLLKAASYSMSQLLSLNLEEPKGLQFESFLRDVQPKTSDIMRILEFQIVLPENVGDLTLSVRSEKLNDFMLFAETTFYLEALLFEAHDTCDGKAAIQKDSLFATDTEMKLSTDHTDVLTRNLFGPMLDFYRDHSYMEIALPGNTFRMEPFSVYQLQLEPTSRFVSETDVCYHNTLGTCVDLCVGNTSLLYCDCYPWNLHYMYHHLDDAKICSRPCPAVVQSACEEECEVNLEHPCDQTLYRLVMGNRVYMDTDPGPSNSLFLNDLFKFSLSINKITNYALITEEYDMTMGNLMSELGGLIDFWLGVNIIGIVHLFMYLVKQVRNAATRPNTKTWRTARRLLGKQVPVPHEQFNNPTEDLEGAERFKWHATLVIQEAKVLDSFKSLQFTTEKKIGNLNKELTQTRAEMKTMRDRLDMVLNKLEDKL